MNDRAMQYRLRPGGPWQALLPGIYLSVTGTPTFEQKEMAALLYAGPESLVTGRAALWHHGIGSGWPPDLIDVLLPAERQRVDVNFVRLHRTARLPSEAVPAGTGPGGAGTHGAGTGGAGTGGTGPGGTGPGGPLRLVPVPRAVADAAWQLTGLDDVRAIVADALRSGRCSLDELTAELNEGPIRGSAALRTVLTQMAEETGSPTTAVP